MVEEKLTENDLMERRREMEEPCCLAPLPPRPARPARAQQPARHVEVSEEGRDALVRWEITYPG